MAKTSQKKMTLKERRIDARERDADGDPIMESKWLSPWTLLGYVIVAAAAIWLVKRW